VIISQALTLHDQLNGDDVVDMLSTGRRVDASCWPSSGPQAAFERAVAGLGMKSTWAVLQPQHASLPLAEPRVYWLPASPDLCDDLVPDGVDKDAWLSRKLSHCLETVARLQASAPRLSSRCGEFLFDESSKEVGDALLSMVTGGESSPSPSQKKLKACPAWTTLHREKCVRAGRTFAEPGTEHILAPGLDTPWFHSLSCPRKKSLIYTMEMTRPIDVRPPGVYEFMDLCLGPARLNMFISYNGVHVVASGTHACVISKCAGPGAFLSQVASEQGVRASSN
jgi:hypothetical protein